MTTLNILNDIFVQFNVRKRLFLLGSLATPVLEAIRQQTLLLWMPLNDDVSDKLIPFSHLKSFVNKYVSQLLQCEWDKLFVVVVVVFFVFLGGRKGAYFSG